MPESGPLRLSHRPVPDAPPFVSVLMPIRNESRFIERSLGAVLGQDYPQDRMEVILADGMSTDDTREIITRMAAASLMTVVVLDNPRGIVATGLNLALARARGDIIVRIDGHTIIEFDYVRECVSALEGTDAANVGGRMFAVGENEFAEAVALATSSRFGVGGARFHYCDRDEWVDTVYLGAWRRTLFDRIGGFDEELVRNQDDEFNYRLREHGGRILLTSRIRSRYYNRATLASLWRQYFQYGYWKVRVMQKHPRQMQARQFVPIALVVSLGAGVLLSFLPPVRVFLAAELLVYLTMLFASSVAIARRTGWRRLVQLPLVFATLHISYGSGFLLGLLRFSQLRTNKAVPN